jgi:hypothetical protein
LQANCCRYRNLVLSQYQQLLSSQVDSGHCLQANGCCCDLVLSHCQQLSGQKGAYHCLQANGARNKVPSSNSGFFLLSRKFFPLPCESLSGVYSPVPLNHKDGRGLFR